MENVGAMNEAVVRMNHNPEGSDQRNAAEKDFKLASRSVDKAVKNP